MERFAVVAFAVERLAVEAFAVERLADEPLERPAVAGRLLDARGVRRRSAAGISSVATPLASDGICFSRNFAMRSSSRRIDLASLAVSLSPTESARLSIAE